MRAGTLAIETQREDLSLATLLDFASRQNPKRGFLFVSKVLGKHIPCRPSSMRVVYDRLAAQLPNLPGPVIAIGMAETATALGGGVADSLARRTVRDDVFYLHTTRHYLAAPILLRFDESHSHAPDHILYAPCTRQGEIFQHAQSLLLIDDEISTGRTLALLAKGLAAHMPRLKKIVLVSIVNWLSTERQHALAQQIPVAIAFANLLEGQFDFQPDPSFTPSLPTVTSAQRRSRYARDDTDRVGLRLPASAQQLPLHESPSGPLVIVGTGEFAFIPFLAAECLEQKGRDVLFQSTTRSPIIEGEAIQSKLVFNDEHDEGIVNYIYNLPNDRQVIAVYEHTAMARAHEFPKLVNATVWALPKHASAKVLQ